MKGRGQVCCAECHNKVAGLTETGIRGGRMDQQGDLSRVCRASCSMKRGVITVLHAGAAVCMPRARAWP